MLKIIAFLMFLLFPVIVVFSAPPVHFSREIRPILSQNCFFCHGPDEKAREAGLRLDVEQNAKRDHEGSIAIVPGKPDESRLIRRIESKDPDEVMPPTKLHKVITPQQIELLKEWIRQGAIWGKHWSYENVVRPTIPSSGESNPVDAFLLQRLKKEALAFSPEADRPILIRRLALDISGLPPTLEELSLLDKSKHEEIVAYYLSKPAFGEHWARQWLDLARYADSAGYPSDPGREIWSYRDWVIQALNDNKSFDQFTIEQLAGDLLPNPTDDQLIATAFHRNTMTNNEGGTNDEEFRVAAIIDRVNTTFAVWMGTTMACAQCHTHKYDPITNHEYFQLYAFLNQTEDADKRDESPLHSFYMLHQNQERARLKLELADLESKFSNPNLSWLAGLQTWEKSLPIEAKWTTLYPLKAVSRSGTELKIDENGRVLAAAPKEATDVYTIELPVAMQTVGAIRIDALSDTALPQNGPGHAGGNFVLSQVKAEIVPDDAKPVLARHVRLQLIGNRNDFLAIAEVQVFSGSENIALKGTATQISTTANGPDAKLAIDGNTDGESKKGKSVSVTGAGTEQPWWQVDLGSEQLIDRIVVWKRTDKGQGLKIDPLKITLMNEEMETVWEHDEKKSFKPREEFSVSGRHEVFFGDAFGDATQDGFNAKDVLSDVPNQAKGWAIAAFTGSDRTLTLLPLQPKKLSGPSKLLLTLNQTSKYAKHTLGAFRISVSDDSRIPELAKIPSTVLSALNSSIEPRSEAQSSTIRDYYVRNLALESTTDRARVASLTKELEGIKPLTVPILKDLEPTKRRTTKVQLRGNWQSLGDVVHAATPEAFNAIPTDAPRNRLTLAQWIVSSENPLTARVAVNRMWETLFGTGIVRSSEEFGSQGDLPEHPELLDWLAAELMESGWDVKHMLSLLLNSRAYRQQSNSTDVLNERDPDNRWLARGPRFRPAGELLRDQALAVSGLLSPKMYGPPVRPLMPKVGLKTAFGKDNDWETSQGEDRHRRSIYTEVRRNNPYPSFNTFDAPNREVCTIRRGRSNTPLQAFVTLNDLVFVESHQALSRRIVLESGPDFESRVKFTLQVCLARNPSKNELIALRTVYDKALSLYQTDKELAKKMTSSPLGLPLEGDNEAILAAWTTVASIVMNLDEFLMRR